MDVMPTAKRYVATVKPAPWPALPLYLLGFANLAMSFLQGSCMCHEGSALGGASALLGLAFLGRVLIARANAETGFGWIPWAALFGASYAWAMALHGLLAA